MYVDRPAPVSQGSAAVLPREFTDFRGYHSGETFLVCGCGSSLSQIVAPERFVTIGVNDVGRLFQPDYLLVLNPPQQFSGDRFRYVEHSRARAVFTQLDLRIPHPHVIRVRLGQRAGTDFSDPNLLPYTRNSPYPALCLAVHMGARRIGLMGVDFTDNHFFAATGKHSLAGEVAHIDQEYRQLQASCIRMGVEVFNLSVESRLTAFPKTTQDEFFEPRSADRFSGRKVFFVHHNFVTCGNVFHEGLAHAADQLGVESKATQWDDPRLVEKVDDFKPDLLFVVNGRRFKGQWGTRFARYRSAVWLLDEPYEVDDTCRYSPIFDTVFLNDPNTLARHRNSHYLPVCYDPKAHSYRPGEDRPHAVGFVGYFSPEREAALGRLARRGFLSYVVGGPWSDSAVNRLCLPKTTAEETAALYRGARIVVNLFRSRHHYNRAGVPAVSLNPRVYEGLGCGALVISEHRPELDKLCPEMPAFHTMEEMEALVERYLQDEQLFSRVRRACIRRLAPHTYSARLASVLQTCLRPAEAIVPISTDAYPENTARTVVVMADPPLPMQPLPQEFAAEWETDSDCVRLEPDGSFLLQKRPEPAPGSERGIVGKASLGNLVLEFDVFLQEDSVLVVKIHQAEPRNHLCNSYHLMCHGANAYLARQSHIFSRFPLPLKTWFRLSFSYFDGAVTVRRNGAQLSQFKEQMLGAGHCFIGIKGGAARLRDLSVKTAEQLDGRSGPLEFDVLQRGDSAALPGVSIVTTVYDRVHCLERCLQSVRALHFRDFEHIVVADAPPAHVLARIEDLVTTASADSGSLTLATLKKRRNDWGISPAAAGLALARGNYVCFLSDDNGYVPSHFDKLVATLEQDPGLGFVYSSCLYGGRATLRASSPRPAEIDLGQPLFRRALFVQHLAGALPFHEFGWDWRMIESFLKKGVRWRHVDEATFVFRLANYPHLMPQQIGQPA
jgi:spore maturation protein CgeB